MAGTQPVLLILLLAHAAGPARADEGRPPEGACADIGMIPALKELRDREARLEKDVRPRLLETVGQLRKDCLVVREKGIGQSNETMASIRARTRELSGPGGLSTQYFELGDALVSEARQLGRAIAVLGHQRCLGDLQRLAAKVRSTRYEVNNALLERCKFGESREDRAKLLADRLGGRGERSAGLSEEEMRQAILDRRSPGNAKLLDEAKRYQAGLPPELQVPSPAKSERDRVCGEACISLLNLQRAEIVYGRGSPQWQEALENAKATRHRVFGT